MRNYAMIVARVHHQSLLATNDAAIAALQVFRSGRIHLPPQQSLFLLLVLLFIFSHRFMRM